MMTPEPGENSQPDLWHRHKNRRWLLTVFGLSALVVLYSVIWWIIAVRAENALDRWAEQQRQAGYAVQWDNVVFSGFPFRLVARLDNPQVEQSGNESFRDIKKWTWAIDALTISGRPWQWRKLHVEAPGTHHLTIEKNGSHDQRTLMMEAGGLAIDAVFINDDWRRISITGNDVRISEQNRVVSELQAVSGDVQREPVADADERTRTGSVQVDIRALNIPVLEDELVRIAGSVVHRAALKAEIYGPLPDDLARQPMTQWRDAGGVMEVRSMLADYGPLSLDAEGTLALDGRLQPVGSFVARLEGYAELIDALHLAGVLTEGNALTAKLVLGAIADRDTATGKSHLSIPINLQDQTVYAGPLEVTKLPMLHW